MKIPFWMQDGKHFIWYRKVRECRSYWNARFVHYLTFRFWIWEKEWKWETR